MLSAVNLWCRFFDHGAFSSSWFSAKLSLETFMCGTGRVCAVSAGPAGVVHVHGAYWNWRVPSVPVVLCPDAPHVWYMLGAA